MFPMTITINNQQQLNAVMAALSGKADAAAPATDKPAAAKPAAAAAKPAAASTDTKARTIEEAKTFTVKLAGKHREPVVELLTKYGVKVAAQLKPDAVTAYVTEIEALAATLGFKL